MIDRKECCCDDLYLAIGNGRVEKRGDMIIIPMLLPQSYAYEAAEFQPIDPKKTTVYTNLPVPYCPFCWIVLDSFAITERQLSLHGHKEKLPYDEEKIPVFKNI